MHIPDSVLSPATSATAACAMLPVWWLAGRRVRAGLGTRQAPLLALGAAFCFTIMMFNIPALGGTTAHPVAGTLLAVLLGPWAACIGISAALAIQALLFGDGGLLAFGANCFTMAFVLPFCGYAVYRLICALPSRRETIRPIAAAIGSYVGLNAGAATVALLLGLQPVLFRDATGHALFFPFGLRITLPAMLGTHLLVAGPAEAIVTAVVVRYLQRAGIPLYRVEGRQEAGARRETLWIGLLALVALSPLGLLAKGDAWGEWDTQGLAREIRKVEGRAYVPAGAARAEAHGYRGVHGLEDYAGLYGAKGYIAAGLLGVCATAAILLLIGQLGGSSFGRKSRATSAKQGAPFQSPSSAKARPVSAVSGQETSRPEEWPRPSRWRAQTAHRPRTGAYGVATHAAVDIEEPNGNDVAGTLGKAAPHRAVLPNWLQRPEDAIPTVRLSGRAPNRYAERTVAQIAASTADALAGERLARGPGLLQRLDPRAKTIGILGLLAAVSGIRRAETLLALYVLTILLAVTSRIPLRTLLPRVWLSVPLFVGAVTLPVALNVVTPGHALCVLWPHPYLAVTAPGVTAFFLLIMRAADAVTLALLLTLSTGWSALLDALRALFVPRIFLGVLTMTYRYVIVLLQTAADMFTARQSRTVGRMANGEGRRFVGATVGALFGKTASLADEVHAAMVSRGFQGDLHTLSRPDWRMADSIWLLCTAFVAALAWGGEHVFR